MENEIKKFIEEGIKKEVEKEFDIMAERMLRDLNSRKNEICSGILLDVMKMTSFQKVGETVVFTIREIK